MKLAKSKLKQFIKEEFDDMLEDVAPSKRRLPSVESPAARLARQATTPITATGDDTYTKRALKTIPSMKKKTPLKRALKRTVGSVKKSGWGGNIGPVNYKGVPQADVSVSKKFKFEEEQQIIEEELDNMLKEQDWRSWIPGYKFYELGKKGQQMITDPRKIAPVDRGQPHDEWMKEYELRKEWVNKAQSEIIIGALRDILKKNPRLQYFFKHGQPPPEKQERLPYVHYDE